MSTLPDATGKRPLETSPAGRPWSVVVCRGILTGLSCWVLGSLVFGVAVAGGFLARWTSGQIFEIPNIEALTLGEVLRWLYLAVAWGSWSMIVSALLQTRDAEAFGVLLSPKGQPEVYGLVSKVMEQCTGGTVAELWIEMSDGVRVERGQGHQEWIVRLGLPIVGVVSGRELAVLLMQGTQQRVGWMKKIENLLHQASWGRDAWEWRLDENQPSGRMRGGAMTQMGKIWRDASVLPLMLGAYAVSMLAWAEGLMTRRWQRRCGVEALGGEGWALLMRKQQLLKQAWAEWIQEVKEGRSRGALPENLVHRLARRWQELSGQCHIQWSDDEERRGAFSEFLRQHVQEVSSVALLVQGFDGLSRHMTHLYYRRELGARLPHYRLTAEALEHPETAQERAAGAALVRYFNGMAHPERAVYGLLPTPDEPVSVESLIEVVRSARAELKLVDASMREAVQKWNFVWRRRRELEAAAALSQAGLDLSEIELGVQESGWAALLTEAGRARMLMEQMETSLLPVETEMERRFAAALGLLWWAEPGELSDALKRRREDLPKWVGVYEPMAGVLPAFREMLNGVFTLQTLAARTHEVTDAGGCMAVLHHLVPRLLKQAQQIRLAVDGALYPEAEQGERVSLAEFLFADPLPASSQVWLEGTELLGIQEKVFKLANDASDFMSPLVDRFLMLYHHAYGWLAETAERSELFFVDSPNAFAGRKKAALLAEA